MIVSMKNVVKRYKDVLALDCLNLDVKQGEIFGLLGPNGSGKTTAINCMLALLKYDKGEIEIFGETMRPDSYALKKQIGVVMQNVAVFEELTVFENIDYFCGLYINDKAIRKQYVEEALAFVGISEYRKMRPKQLSGGLIRRLNIACGIAHKPKLIFMDEPTVAVDPQSRNKILEGIMELNRQGSTIIYTSHYMEEVEQICTRISILDRGRTIATGTKDELKELIKSGESIQIDAVSLTPSQQEDIKGMPYVFSMEYSGEMLKIKCTKGSQNTVKLLNYLQENKILFGKVYAQLPTLNDVFLEITGKELRD